jgi:hypothetical protein
VGDRVASIIIPVGHYHRDVVDRAYHSAIHQTVPCDVLVIHDDDKRGASWARNQGIAQAVSPFVIFLDADDEMHPMFVEKTLRRWLELGAGAHYIYTDWRLPDGRVRYADECFNFFDVGMAHINTTLISLGACYAAGGFDEAMRGGEDEDFYARVRMTGMCHARVSEPLVNYNIGQGASATNPTTNPDYPAAAAAIDRRFRHKYSKYRGVIMGCCGNNTPPQGQVPLNEPFEESVLAYALYTPARMTGPKSGIGYKRAGLGQQMYVHRDDQAARPDLWQIVPKVENLVPDKDDVLKLSGLV